MPAGGALNILAIEPFFGGRRRDFVCLVQRHSRHRWDWRTLPARRMQRRLATSAAWAADELERHPPIFAGEERPPDVLFVSEALYLNELLRQVKALAKLPRVMYVHDHGESALPRQSREYDFSPKPKGVEHIHLLGAVAATSDKRGQLWFASSYHAAAFLLYTDELFLANQHLFTDDPRRFLEEHARVVPQPVCCDEDDSPLREKPNRRRVIVAGDTSEGAALSAVFGRMMLREEPFDLVAIGEVEGLGGVPHAIIDPRDDAATSAAIRTSRAYLAAGRESWFDPWAVRALRADIWPIVPGLGRESCYDEVIPHALQAGCFHDDSPARVMNLLQTAWHAGRPELSRQVLAGAIAPFDPVGAVEAIDGRLDELKRK